jgi:hypothetical protein
MRQPEDTTMTTPFRPSAADLARIGDDVAPIAAIQQKLVANHPRLAMADRVAHQYQVAGGKALLRIAQTLPAHFAGVGLFVPGAQYTGIGRISTGLGCPHLETDPDFLGLMVAFHTSGGQRVDFLCINDPTSPTDTHPQFIKLLDATADAAGAEPAFGGGLGELDIASLAASNLRLIRSLIASLGPVLGLKVATHVAKQTARTALSSTAYQTYWTGIAEVGGALGKFMFTPETDENHLRALTPGERHLSGEWRQRQARGDINFKLNWLPFIDEPSTSTTELTKPWAQRPIAVGQLTFPRIDAADTEATLLGMLAAELGANAGNWVADAGNTIPEPSTEFACARKLAYRNSQAGRNALPESAYAHVFSGQPIGAALAAELQRRRATKEAAGHTDMAP